jgi:hypothetical protein
MQDSKNGLTGSASGQPEPHASSDGTRPPLEYSKPPREWRMSRTAEGRAVAAPRVVRTVSTPDAAPPAGSHAPEPVVTDEPSHAPMPASGPAIASGPAVAPPDDLPVRYGVDRLVFLVRDPYWAYAWWELTEASLGEGRRVLAAACDLVLRIYDISAIEWNGGNHHSHFDIEITDLAGNWYIELGKPGSSFVGEVGLRGHDGRFLALLRSNFITLPRDSMSPVVDEEWMVVEEDYRLLFDLAGGSNIGIGSGEIQRMLEQRLRAELAAGSITSPGVSSATARERKP